MPAFTLYGSRGSTNTDRVRLTLAEGGFTDYELVLINLQKGEQKVSDQLFFLQGRCGFLLCGVYIALNLKISSLSSNINSLPITFDSLGS